MSWVADHGLSQVADLNLHAALRVSDRAEVSETVPAYSDSRVHAAKRVPALMPAIRKTVQCCRGHRRGQIAPSSAYALGQKAAAGSGLLPADSLHSELSTGARFISPDAIVRSFFSAPCSSARDCCNRFATSDWPMRFARLMAVK